MSDLAIYHSLRTTCPELLSLAALSSLSDRQEKLATTVPLDRADHGVFAQVANQIYVISPLVPGGNAPVY
jgi:hypothetical protein